MDCQCSVEAPRPGCRAVSPGSVAGQGSVRVAAAGGGVLAAARVLVPRGARVDRDQVAVVAGAALAAPAGDEILVDTLGQSVGLPAASGLALECVLPWSEIVLTVMYTFGFQFHYQY